MTMLTVRNLDPQVKQRLQKLAADHGRSMEAEVREILADAVRRRPTTGLAEVVLDVFHGVDIEIPDFVRPEDLASPVEF